MGYTGPGQNSQETNKQTKIQSSHWADATSLLGRQLTASFCLLASDSPMYSGSGGGEELCFKVSLSPQPMGCDLWSQWSTRAVPELDKRGTGQCM